MNVIKYAFTIPVASKISPQNKPLLGINFQSSVI